MPRPAVNIAGAGLAGALMAVMLARRGISVNVFERRPDPRVHSADAGRSINLALAARGIRALEHAGLMQRIRPVMLPMRGRMIHDPQADAPPRLLPYGQREHEVIYSVGRAALNRVLIEAAAQWPQVTLHFDTICEGVDPSTGVVQWVHAATGARGASPPGATLATDGAGSALRGALERDGRIAVRNDPLAHDYKELHIPARRGGFALAADALHVWPRRGFMLIALPNPDSTFTATLFLPANGDPGFNLLHDDAAVQGFFNREFPQAAQLIPDLVAQFRAHPQGHLGTVHVDPWACGSVLLLGDAAHAIVPFHGQGMNAAFEDCALLDSTLDICDADRDWRAIFADFYAMRRGDAAAIAQMALENYSEMRSAVLDARFLRQKAWALQLERLHPQSFIPRYAMVMFHPEIAYREALRRGTVQQQILDTLDTQRAADSHDRDGPLSPVELARARDLVTTRL